jgi:hypothetical protein
MLHMASFLAMHLFEGPDSSAYALFGFLSISSVALFVVFLPAVSWIDARRKEREAYYRSETLRRISEATGDGAKAALELLWEQGRQKQISLREGIKIGGVIDVGVGVGLLIFLRILLGGGGVYLCGLVPLFIGVAMLVYVYVLAAPVTERRKD